jgi:hypothetical protein
MVTVGALEEEPSGQKEAAGHAAQAEAPLALL